MSLRNGIRWMPLHGIGKQGTYSFKFTPSTIPPETAVKSYPAIVGIYDRLSGDRAFLPNGESYTAVPELDIVE